jgi:hypothetical protein
MIAGAPLCFMGGAPTDLKVWRISGMVQCNERDLEKKHRKMFNGKSGQTVYLGSLHNKRSGAPDC